MLFVLTQTDTTMIDVDDFVFTKPPLFKNHGDNRNVSYLKPVGNYAVILT